MTFYFRSIIVYFVVRVFYRVHTRKQHVKYVKLDTSILCLYLLYLYKNNEPQRALIFTYSPPPFKLLLYNTFIQAKCRARWTFSWSCAMLIARRLLFRDYTMLRTALPLNKCLALHMVQLCACTGALIITS